MGKLLKSILIVTTILLAVMSGQLFRPEVFAASVIPDEFKMVGETEYLELYYNYEKPSIIIMEKGNSCVWTSFANEKDYNSSELNDIWNCSLNSLFNFSYIDFLANKGITEDTNALYEKSEFSTNTLQNGIRINYEFIKTGICIQLDIWVDKDSLNISIPYDRIVEKNERYGLTNIELMPFFGSASDSEDGYFFYPDGCGALMYFKNTRRANTGKYKWPVYGMDVSEMDMTYEGFMNNKNREDLKQAMLPVYGVKKDNSAFVAIITEGDTDSLITLYPSGYVVRLNRICADMVFRRTYPDPRKNDIRRYEPDLVKINHTVNYVFLDKEPDYSGMANAYRNHLIEYNCIKQGIMPGDSVPIGLNLFMGIMEERMLFDRYIKMTDFDEAISIIDEFSRNDIEAMDVKLIGWNNGGFGNSPSQLPPDRRLGGNKKLTELAGYAREKHIPLYLESNFLLHSNKNGKLFGAKNAVRLQTGLIFNNPFEDIHYINPTILRNNYTDDFIPKIEKTGIGGIAFSSIGSIIYSDFNKNYPVNRKMTSEYWNEFAQLSSDKTGKAMVQGGNAYMLKSADRLCDIDNTDSGYYITDETIPFYQMVVHGLIPYSSGPVNLFHNYEYQKLKMIEYGCIPEFILTYRSSSLLKYTNANYLFSSYYRDWLDVATEVYKEFNEKIKGVWDQYMIKHEKLQENLYKVTYANGTVLYFNYNEHEVNAQGYKVGALDYCVVKKGGIIQ